MDKKTYLKPTLKSIALELEDIMIASSVEKLEINDIFNFDEEIQED